MKFLSKTTLYIAGLSKHDIFRVGRNIRKSRYINIFTGRGVRFAQQRVYKKTGKVSTYR
jgi:ribosomal protein L6P/L9E